MNKNYDDTFLARWLNNDLSDKELEAFKSSPDFLLYQKIAKKSSELVAPEFNNQKVFEEISKKVLEKKQPKVRKLFSSWMYAAAASVVILFGVFFYLDQPTEFNTGVGEQLAITLPDNSEVILNAKSSIQFKEKEWKIHRTITLKGEAYFKVQKGKTFTVKTTEGEVVVLGTEFTVNQQSNLFEVQCFEGKVKATTNTVDEILTQGKAFRKLKDSVPERWVFKDSIPSWKKGESSFISVPLQYVIMALENQYDITINSSKIDVNQKFTGSFTHKNLTIALQTVFVPMKIETKFTDEKTVMLVKQ